MSPGKGRPALAPLFTIGTIDTSQRIITKTDTHLRPVRFVAIAPAAADSAHS